MDMDMDMDMYMYLHGYLLCLDCVFWRGRGARLIPQTLKAA